MSRQCPECEVEMNKRVFLGVELDTCQGCGGIFFDEGEISQVKAKGGPAAFDELEDLIQPEPNHVSIEEHHFRTCPGCKATMHRYRYMYTSPVFLDSCEACGGVWIDNGELHQMRLYLQAAKSEGSLSSTAARDQAVATLDAMTAAQQARAQRARANAWIVAHRW